MLRGILIASLLALPAYAEERIVVNSGDRQTAVVELYTSEGCSSCPPADRWLSQLVEVPADELDVLALAFHVDYWDYLGWKDRFASSHYTSRQRQLGANNLQRTIYTPEFFVNGKEARGSRSILGKIRQANEQPAPLDLRLAVSRSGDALRLELDSSGERDTLGPVHLRFLVYENELSTEVKRGENSGETLQHQQVVRYMSSSRILKTNNQYQITLEQDWQQQNLGVAVLLTSPGNVRYIQALHTPIAEL